MSEYVKFTYERTRTEITTFPGFAELNQCRRKLRDLDLIGVDSSGIGFGNLSVRDGATSNFYITGSATGGVPDLSPADCVRVVAYDFEKNWVRYEGSAIPSSESLTHAAIYEADATTGAVIHCHERVLWATLLDHVPTTRAVAYGTPEMAYEIIRLFKCNNLQTGKILVMAGHEGGIITFGKDLEEAFAALIRERDGTSPCIENGFLRIRARHDG